MGILKSGWWATAITFGADPVRTAAAFGLAIMAGVSTVLFSFLVGRAVQVAATGTGSVTSAALLLLAALLAQQLLPVLASLLSVKVGMTTANSERLRLHRMLSRLDDLAIFDRVGFHNAVYASRTAIDAGLETWLHGLLGLMRVMVSAVALLSLMISVGGAAMLLMLGVFVVAGWAERRTATLRTEHVAEIASVDRERMMFEALAADRDPAIETRVLGAATFLGDQYRLVLDETVHIRHRLERRVALVTLLRWAGISIIGGVAVVASLQQSDGMSPGDVAALLTAFVALQFGLNGLVSQSGTQLQAVYLIEHLRAFTTEHGMVNTLENKVHDQSPSGSQSELCSAGGAGRSPSMIRFDQVSFRYPSSETWAISNLDLELRRGELVGVVGENGAGKSTLTRLALGVYRPQRGRVLWDGVDVSTLDPDTVAAASAVITQAFTKYELSLRDNVLLGLSATDDEVLDTLKCVSFNVDALPAGLDTRLTTRFAVGSTDELAAGTAELSGGLWQRVGLARMLTRSLAAVLIADEPSSALDPIQETATASTIATHAKGRIGLVVTHRLGILRHVDRILVMHAGRIVGDGTHHQLLDVSAQYHRMYTSQIRQYEELDAH